MEFQVSSVPQGAYPFSEESLPLITFNNETQKFEVNQALQPMFEALKGPIGVIAVAGQYRTGKSYLLNRMLLNRQKGFGVGPTINPCTKGLWVWGQPVQGQTADGKPINVIVVDSEGIGGLDEDNNHDMRIFSLAMLLSSYFLYNSVGSIDENALSNLSLVTNLSKHIQFKSKPPAASSPRNTEEESQDLDQLIEYMPSFMWVVRDFALQLCDEEGNEINSKEYLERALQEKGSDAKNDIRRHLKKFFRDRECCTMIRPLTNEDELQNLEHMDLEELRAEFVEQVMTLRKKVLAQMKPKTLGGQVLDGSLWLQMVQQYVHAINEGHVPNIHSSWTYICRQNANQALETCKNAFEQEIQDQIHLPMNQEDLDGILSDLKKYSLEKMSKLLKGDPDIVDEFMLELQTFIDSKTSNLIQRNQQECRQYASELLAQLFTEFEQQIKSQQSFDLHQIDLTLKEVHQVYDQNCIDFPEKPYLLAEAKSSFLQDTLYYLTQKLESDFQLQRQIDSQAKERLEISLKEAKEESKNEMKKIEDKARQAVLEKTEIEAQYQFLREQYENLKTAKEADDKALKDEIQQLRERSSLEIEEYKVQKEEFEEKIQEIQRHLIQAESEFDKERALFEQKVQFLEKSLQEKSAKERDFMAERQSQKQGINSELKTLQTKFESELKQLQATLEEEKEKSIEAEALLAEKVSLINEKQNFWEMQEQQYKQMIQQAQDQVKQMEMTVQALRKDNESRLSQNVKEKEGKVEQYTAQISDLETQLRECQETLKQRDNEYKKEKAIRDQKFQFLEMQLQDCQEQLEESHRQHEQMVKAMKSDIASESEASARRKVSPSKLEALQLELQRSQEEQALRQIEQQGAIEQLQEKLNEMELQLKLRESDFDRENKELRNQIAELEFMRASQIEKIKLMETAKVKFIEDSDRKYKQTVARFEEEIEFKAQQSQLELKEMQERSEEALAQLKNFYEIEKETLEQRIGEERDKNTRRLQHYQEELELRMRDDLQEKEEEIECLQNELRESEQRHQSYVTQMEHELSLKHQMMETLERQVRESRERIEMLEYGKNSAFEKQIEHFEQQRQEYNQKIDRLQIENLDKDRQLAQLTHKLERINDDLDRKKAEMDSYKQAQEKEKKTIADKLESTKKKLAEAQDEAMKHRLELGREQALSKQQVEFQQKKIDELQKSYDENQRFIDEKIRAIRSEIQDEAQAQVERITSEKELWENKYEQKRRALKEIEMSLSKSNNDLEKKLVQFQAQVERLEDDKRTMEEQYQDEIHSLNQQIQALDSSAGAAYYYGSAHAEDVLKYKQQLQDLERELSDLQSTYDRDKALWEGKCQFLETQKETYKRDLVESQKKFEITLEQLQKRGNLDKDKFENNQNSLIKVIENKYKTQIKEMLDIHQALLTESQQKVKRLEAELKQKNEQLQLEVRGKLSEYGSLEKKVLELNENEKRLLQELDEVKAERERRIQEYQRQIDKDKDTYKQKLSEYEQKAKESESRRVSLMFEYEKERAKWQLEKDNLQDIQSKLSETVEKLQVRKDQLLRENEKLKTENKGSRKYLFQGSNVSNLPLASGHQTMMSGSSQASTNNHSSTSATRYMVGKSMSGAVGQNILSQAMSKMKENNKYIGSSIASSYGVGKEDDGSKSGAGTSHTTPNTKHQYRYGN